MHYVCVVVIIDTITGTPGGTDRVSSRDATVFVFGRIPAGVTVEIGRVLYRTRLADSLGISEHGYRLEAREGCVLFCDEERDEDDGRFYLVRLGVSSYLFSGRTDYLV